MRDPARIARIVNKLRVLWHANPDLRLGQLVDNLHSTALRNSEVDPHLFYLEDDEMEKAVDLATLGEW